MKWAPRITVGSMDYSFSLPMRPPEFPNQDIGGSETAAGGVPASYVAREDYLAAITLRFYEYERPDVEALVREMQKHFATIRFYPDQDEDDFQTCYLESPQRGERWSCTRSPELADGRGMELSITLRSIIGPWLFVEYFPEE